MCADDESKTLHSISTGPNLFQPDFLLLKRIRFSESGAISDLVRIAGLDPRQDFIGCNLDGLDWRGTDKNLFDLSGCEEESFDHFLSECIDDYRYREANLRIRQLGLEVKRKDYDVELVSVEYNSMENLQEGCLYLKNNEINITSIDMKFARWIKSLADFEGMPIRSLSLQNASINDLSPISGMPLEEVNIDGSFVEDLSALSGKNIRYLSAEQTNVIDISSLEGCPIEYLNLSKTNVSNLNAVKNAPIKELNISETRIKDLSPLFGMRLSVIDISELDIKDLTPIDGMPITDLKLRGSSISDISPITNFPLTTLDLSYTKITSLHALAGMSLESINIQGTRVDSLEPLVGMSVIELRLWGTDVSSLAPLEGMPLNWLEIGPPNLVGGEMKIKDLSPLRGMEVDIIGASSELLRTLKEEK